MEGPPLLIWGSRVLVPRLGLDPQQPRDQWHQASQGFPDAGLPFPWRGASRLQRYHAGSSANAVFLAQCPRAEAHRGECAP